MKKIQNKKLKIAFVQDAIYPYNKGGKEKRLYELSTRLSAMGHDVHIYCMKWWEGKSIRKENGVTLHGIGPLYPLYSGERRSFRQAILFALHCFKLIREDFDVLDADHMPHLVLFPLKIVTVLKRKKLTATWNEVWGRKYWKQYIGILGEVAYLIERVSALLPDEIIAVSQHTEKKLKKELKVKTNISIVPNGIDLAHIKSIKPSKIKSDVIFAGRLLSHKNVDMLIKAISELKKHHPKIKCIIVGNGPEKIKLMKLAEKLDLKSNIAFIDFLENHDDLYALMKSSKVFVLPSTREGFGIVVLEANACGIPAIVTNHPDNAAQYLITNNGNIIYNSARNIEIAISRQILLYEREGDKYLNIIFKYEWKYISEKYIKVAYYES